MNRFSIDEFGKDSLASEICVGVCKREMYERKWSEWWERYSIDPSVGVARYR